jgi:hypothetical protein
MNTEQEWEQKEEQRRKVIESVICPACGNINRVAVEALGPQQEMNRLYDLPYGMQLCAGCSLRYPPALLKATNDPFDYALRLRSGEVFFFSEATIHGDFVSLELKTAEEMGGTAHSPSSYNIPFDRGVDVRASDIVWCADAPFGS